MHSTSATEQAIHAFYLLLYVTSCIGSSALKMKGTSLIDELHIAVNIVVGRLRGE